MPGANHFFLVGGEYANTPLGEIDTESLRRNMNASFESNFCTTDQPQQ